MHGWSFDPKLQGSKHSGSTCKGPGPQGSKVPADSRLPTFPEKVSKVARLQNKVPRFQVTRLEGVMAQGSKVAQFQESMVSGFKGSTALRLEFQGHGFPNILASKPANGSRIRLVFPGQRLG